MLAVPHIGIFLDGLGKIVTGTVTNKILNSNTNTKSIEESNKSICFEAGTLILTESGYKKIEEIEVGDYVYSYNEKLKISELKKVVKLFVNNTEILYNISIENEILKVTENHPFYVKNSCIPVIDLKVKDKVLLYNGKTAEINQIFKEVKDTKVYNFEVEDNHNYYVGISGILVHNDCWEKTEPRYNESSTISQEEYKKLRTKTPSSEITNKVNENINDLIGTRDRALNQIIEKKLEADHIVSMKNITRMDGFNNLTFEQKLQVLNNQDNFIGLTKTANTSKGSKTYEEWTLYKKGNIPVNSEFRQEMMKLEQEMAKKLQYQIDLFNNLK